MFGGSKPYRARDRELTLHMNDKRMHRPHAMRGFTLIEIMVVVVIIGLLVGIVAPNVIGQLGKAEVGAARADIDRLATALDLFRLDHYRYPTADEGLEILMGNAEINNRPVEKLIDSVPLDPWQRPYYYVYPSTRGDEYDLYTLGRDGEEGGEGIDADIGTWNLR